MPKFAQLVNTDATGRLGRTISAQSDTVDVSTIASRRGPMSCGWLERRCCPFVTFEIEEARDWAAFFGATPSQGLPHR
jgi:hypothetical protein